MSNRITLFNFFDLFPDDKSCFDKLLSLKYPNGLTCKCSSIKFTKHPKRPVYQCGCGFQISILKGTIFEGSKTHLQFWFFAVFAVSSTKTGLSAKQLQRFLGLSYQTCFTMLHKIRTVMAPEKRLLKGIVESDETAIKWSSLKRRYRTNFNEDVRAMIFGTVERGGNAVFQIIPNYGKRTILDRVQKTIEVGTHVVTDQGRWYTQLSKHGYKHDYVIHRREYVKEDNPEVHTQTIESLWSQLKRNIIGTYRGAISVKYLDNYNNEYTWGYNQRRENKFDKLLRLSIGI